MKKTLSRKGKSCGNPRVVREELFNSEDVEMQEERTERELSEFVIPVRAQVEGRTVFSYSDGETNFGDEEDDEEWFLDSGSSGKKGSGAR